MPSLQTPAPTFDDVWRTIQELALFSKETAAESERRFQEAERRSQEADRRFQETERLMKEQFAETERLMKEQSAETERLMKEQSAETERLMKEQSAETERFMKEQSAQTERNIKKVSTEIGNLGNRLGSFVEEMVKPGLVELFQQRGLKVHRTMQNLVRRDDAGRLLAQVDLLVIDGDMAIAVECKSHLSLDDVNEHLRRLAAFKEHWPEYACYRLLGAVAAMVLPEDVGRNAYRKGLYVLAQKGERVEIRNDARFEPRVW